MYGIPCAVVLMVGFLYTNPSNGVRGDSSHLEGNAKNKHSEYADNTSSLGGFFITITCSDIYEDLTDIPEDKQPIIIIRKEMSRSKKSELPGLRFEAVIKNEVYRPDVVYIPNLY